MKKKSKIVSNFKYLPTIISMGISLICYTPLYGFSLALGLLLLTLLHEFGHSIAAHKFGLKTGVPIFIPFFVAFVSLETKPRSSFVWSFVGFGGPFAGFLGALAAFGLGKYCENIELAKFWMSLAGMTAAINYLNLVPFMKLDGESITLPLKSSHWVAMIIILFGLAFWTFEKISDYQKALVVALLLGVVCKAFWVLKKSFVTPKESLLEKLQKLNSVPEEDLVTGTQRNISFLLYVLLILALTVLMQNSKM